MKRRHWTLLALSFAAVAASADEPVAALCDGVPLFPVEQAKPPDPKSRNAKAQATPRKATPSKSVRADSVAGTRPIKTQAMASTSVPDGKR